mgnify:FL=1|jgi:peptide-methionine (R)-S-oxide reductase|tara:strand:+ start:265 stop:663 length:399 start_codon:yes stop_codon:yes gene_type:complete
MAEKVTKSDTEWRRDLTEEQYHVTRQKGTERAFAGALCNNKERGVYRCVCCGNDLFSSDTKYESGSGWPSFWQPLAEDRVAEEEDHSHGMVRIEALCSQCDAHLGHVFPDGPRPTGLRYCMNSAALRFERQE